MKPPLLVGKKEPPEGYSVGSAKAEGQPRAGLEQGSTGEQGRSETSHVHKLMGREVSRDTQSCKCINKPAAALRALLLLPLASFPSSFFFRRGSATQSQFPGFQLLSFFRPLTVLTLGTLRAAQAAALRCIYLYTQEVGVSSNLSA